MLRAENISYSVGSEYLLEPATLDFAPGSFHVVMGANGAGKSTLIRLLSGDLSPRSGSVFLSDVHLLQYDKVMLARKRAVLSQHYDIHFPITVDEIILMGRYPYFKNRPSAADFEICSRAKEMMQITALGQRDYLTLSGGEAQKVHMCRVLAQIGGRNEGGGKVLFLDEPVSHLDLKYQYELLKVARELCSLKHTVVAVLHDINLALSFADRILFMKQGKIAFDVRDVRAVSSAMIEEVFDVRARILYPEPERPLVMLEKQGNWPVYHP